MAPSLACVTLHRLRLGHADLPEASVYKASHQARPFFF
jgi:hypothetical protein